MNNQLVDVNYQFTGTDTSGASPLIENYVYLHHTSTLILLPTWPESLTDTMNANYSETSVLARSAPIYSYVNSGPRAITVNIQLHRDLMNNVNTENCSLLGVNVNTQDYVDTMIAQLQACALPRYAASEKMVNPPLVSVRFGNDLFCKGVVNGSVTTTFSGPILRGDKYALVNVEFSMSEVDPYDADTVMKVGSFRGLSTDLERRIYKTGKASRSVQG